MIKSIFFDIDGTLISFQLHAMPESTKKALELLRKEGIKLFLATGRSPHSLPQLKEILKFQFDGYVMLNGQYCLADGKILRDECLPVDSLEQIYEYMHSNNISCDFLEIDYVYANFINDKMIHLQNFLGKTFRLSPIGGKERIYKYRTYQICPFIMPEEEEEFFQNMPGCRAVRWNPLFVDVIPENGGKAAGMREVLSYFGFSNKECMAFGDGGNDMEMLDYAGVGIAMGNAGDEVKKAADYITEDVDKDGIWQALLHFGLIKQQE